MVLVSWHIQHESCHFVEDGGLRRDQDAEVKLFSAAKKLNFILFVVLRDASIDKNIINHFLNSINTMFASMPSLSGGAFQPNTRPGQR